MLIQIRKWEHCEKQLHCSMSYFQGVSFSCSCKLEARLGKSPAGFFNAESGGSLPDAENVVIRLELYVGALCATDALFRIATSGRPLFLLVLERSGGLGNVLWTFQPRARKRPAASESVVAR